MTTLARLMVAPALALALSLSSAATAHADDPHAYLRPQLEALPDQEAVNAVELFVYSFERFDLPNVFQGVAKKGLKRYRKAITRAKFAERLLDEGLLLFFDISDAESSGFHWTISAVKKEIRVTGDANRSGKVNHAVFKKQKGGRWMLVELRTIDLGGGAD